ncbi:MAG TPA: hypothetical protein VHE78_17355 [Gemmatimonadaceae bacterium]|nr:hypothetical protein [Gemmatimonadaceae bacterium]
MRAAAFVLVAMALWRLRAGATGAVQRVSGDAIERELATFIVSPAAAVHVTFEDTPSPAARDVLAAVARAGTRVTWTGASLTPLAISAERMREPSAPVIIAAASGGQVELRDGIAVLDTLRADAGATLEARSPAGTLGARAGHSHAAVAVGAPVALKPVLVLGRASWESKFTVAALEEAGWAVEVRLAVAPGADVTQGRLGTLDTSRYAAVVALDSALGPAGAGIVRFVRHGGGLVLLGGAGSAPAVRIIAPARPGPRRMPLVRSLGGPLPWDALPLYPLESVRLDAVRLAMRGAGVAAAARREGAGRVVQVGYDETWRWRMQGGDDAVAAHRAWWSRLVGSVAASPQPDGTEWGSAEGAPLARLVDALGPSSPAPADGKPPNHLPPWLLPATLAVLLAEWTSRRLRGAR